MEEMERIESDGHNDRTDSRDRDLEGGEGALYGVFVGIVFVGIGRQPCYNGYMVMSIYYNGFLTLTYRSSVAMALVPNPYSSSTPCHP